MTEASFYFFCGGVEEGGVVGRPCHYELAVGNKTKQKILEPLRIRVIVLWRGLIVLLRLHVVQCVFDKERPLMACGHFFVHRRNENKCEHGFSARMETNCEL